MAGHRLLLPQLFPETQRASTAASTARQLQDILPGAASDGHHLHIPVDKRPQLIDSNVLPLGATAPLTQNTRLGDDHRKPAGAVSKGTSHLAAGEMSFAQPVLHSTAILSRDPRLDHSPPLVQTLKLSFASPPMRQSGGLSGSSSSDDESLSEGEIPTLSQHDRIISPVEVTLPARQAATTQYDTLPPIGQPISAASIHRDMSGDEMGTNKDEVSPLTLSQLQESVEGSVVSQSGSDDVGVQQVAKDRERRDISVGNEAEVGVQLEDVGVHRQCDASTHSDISQQEEPENGMVEMGAQPTETSKPFREELWSPSISSVSSLSLPSREGDEPSGESEEKKSDTAGNTKLPDEPQNHLSKEISPGEKQDLPCEDAPDTSVIQSSFRDELNTAASSEPLQLDDPPSVDFCHLQRLTSAIEHDLDVGMEIDDLYRAEDCSQAMKKRIRE